MNNTVIVFHCVPHEIEANIELLWVSLKKALIKQKIALLVVSTTKIVEKELDHLIVPFDLRLLATDDIKKSTESIESGLRDTIARWYRIQLTDAENILKAAERFHKTLIETHRPIAVVSWQSSHPFSRTMRMECVRRDIPWWSAERGWLPNTIMIDLCENNYLTEAKRSLTIRRLLKNYRPSKYEIDNFLEKVKRIETISRYPKENRKQSPLRKRYHIDQKSAIWTIFTHGEPHVNELTTSIRNVHYPTGESLNEQLIKIAIELKKAGDTLIVREHPFNKIYDRMTKGPASLSNVIYHEGDIEELISETFVGLFTLSTLQFSWAMKEKPFGLLSRSLLSGLGLAPEWENFSSTAQFLNECSDTVKWRERKTLILDKLSIIYNYALIDISPQNLNDSAEELSDILVSKP